MKHFSEACERNREPILGELTRLFAQSSAVLEIGSGSGQHAAYFAPRLPHLVWQPSDLAENLPSIAAWRAESEASNLLPPLELDLFAPAWPPLRADAVFCANTVHIVSWAGVERLFAGAGRLLTAPGLLCLYGPFNYGGAYTSESNARFDTWLKARDPASGIRDLDAVNALAAAQSLILQEDIAMPANNRLITWRKDTPLPA